MMLSCKIIHITTYDFLQDVIIAENKQTVLDDLQITAELFLSTVMHSAFF